jgi:hypothetical protein
LKRHKKISSEKQKTPGKPGVLGRVNLKNKNRNRREKRRREGRR